MKYTQQSQRSTECVVGTEEEEEEEFEVFLLLTLSLSMSLLVLVCLFLPLSFEMFLFHQVLETLLTVGTDSSLNLYLNYIIIIMYFFWK